MLIQDAVLLSVCLLMVIGFVLYIFNHKLGVWACHHLRWHLPPLRSILNKVRRCPRCGRKVFLDEDGAWHER